MGGHANSNGLYLIRFGRQRHHLRAQRRRSAIRTAYLQGAAVGLTNSIVKLQAAGARTIIVPGLNYSFPIADPSQQALELAYTKALWSGLAAQGVNFIPGDFNSVRSAIPANPSAFGFQFVGSTQLTACTSPP